MEFVLVIADRYAKMEFLLVITDRYAKMDKAVEMKASLLPKFPSVSLHHRC